MFPLDILTAEQIMTPNPVSIRQSATVQDALKLFTLKAVNAAPVVDDAGRPVGVLSQGDLLVYLRETQEAQLPQSAPAPPVAPSDSAQIRNLMTPMVLAVDRNVTAMRVVRELVAMNVHQLFVVDDTGVLVGVITAGDILRRLIDAFDQTQPEDRGIWFAQQTTQDASAHPS